ncbi:MAG: tRNA 4-thiouridine(8) synthase ThiI [Myxococcales bacterium]|nr:tRNA 4-thiouridine(8) synthase ThiI [Myxococcales bacterium]
MSTPLIFCRMGEVWLKGRNRDRFLRRLQANVQASMDAEIPGCVVRMPHARLLVHLPPGASVERAVAICRDTPGISLVSPAVEVAPDADAIEEAAAALVAARWAGQDGSFRVKVHRGDKRFPGTSTELGARIGSRILLTHGWPVDLTRPDRTVYVDLAVGAAFVSVERYAGAGGLPVGSTGRVLLLLSGGIDSPVAGYLAQKRGCDVEAIYFHSAPHVSEASRDKVVALARKLAPRQGGLTLHVVPFTRIQETIRDAGGSRLSVLLYRRFMYRIAAALAARRKLLALCTGESLGQVASQTLENLRLVDMVSDALTLRPLITTDKQDIMDLARRLGTYDISVLPHQDCCTLFVPEHPTTRAPIGLVVAHEAELAVDELVADALARTEVVAL